LVDSTGQISVPIHHLSILQKPVFLINSRFLQLVSQLLAFRYQLPPLSRSYWVILQSSLNQVLSPPWCSQPTHLWWISVRFVRKSYFSLQPERQDCLTIRQTFVAYRSLMHSWRVKPLPLFPCFRYRGMRGRITLIELVSLRKPWVFGDGLFLTIYTTHGRILACAFSRDPQGSPF